MPIVVPKYYRNASGGLGRGRYTWMPVTAEPLTGSDDGRAAREIIGLADGLVGRIWVQFQARAAEFNLSVPEAKSLQAMDPERPIAMRELAGRLDGNRQTSQWRWGASRRGVSLLARGARTAVYAASC